MRIYTPLSFKFSSGWITVGMCSRLGRVWPVEGNAAELHGLHIDINVYIAASISVCS